MSDSAIGRWLVVAAALVVVATLIAALAVMGLPSRQRDVRFDERRVSDLERIVSAIDGHAERHGTLPADLATLATRAGSRLVIADPADGAPYAYEITGKRSYRLCAVFTTDTAKLPEGAGAGLADEWLHGAGRQCFERKRKGTPKQI